MTHHCKFFWFFSYTYYHLSPKPSSILLFNHTRLYQPAPSGLLTLIQLEVETRNKPKAPPWSQDTAPWSGTKPTISRTSVNYRHDTTAPPWRRRSTKHWLQPESANVTQGTPSPCPPRLQLLPLTSTSTERTLSPPIPVYIGHSSLPLRS